MTDANTKQEPKPTIRVVIPALNEESSIGHVLGDIDRALVDEVIVVDNGSRDGTVDVARAAGATVLSEPRRGYGWACLAGIEHARQRGTDVLVFLDGDYSDHPEELAQVVGPIISEGFDMVIGSRARGEREPGALLPQARFGNWLATWLIWLVWRHRYTDLGPFRALKFDKLLALNMEDKTYGWTVEMQIKALKQGLRVTEVPVRYRRRIGQSKVTGTIRGTVLAGYKILWTIARYAV